MSFIMMTKDDSSNTRLNNVTLDFRLSVKYCNASATIDSVTSATIGVQCLHL